MVKESAVFGTALAPLDGFLKDLRDEYQTSLGPGSSFAETRVCALEDDHHVPVGLERGRSPVFRLGVIPISMDKPRATQLSPREEED